MSEQLDRAQSLLSEPITPSSATEIRRLLDAVPASEEIFAASLHEALEMQLADLTPLEFEV